MNIKPAILQIFDQLIFLIENLSNAEYSKPAKVLHNNSIGQHMRHTLEFFNCLINGLPSAHINYDQRERDVFLESNTLEALANITKLKEKLNDLDENLSLKLISDLDNQQTGVIMEVPTNLYRELIYNVEHAVHHMALIKIGLTEVKSELKLPENFGVASSTVKYRQSQQVTA